MFKPLFKVPIIKAPIIVPTIRPLPPLKLVPDEKELKEKIKNYQMQDLVLIYGKVSARSLLPLIYARADLLLFPSLMDTSSLVRIEAVVNETLGLFIDGSIIM